MTAAHLAPVMLVASTGEWIAIVLQEMRHFCVFVKGTHQSRLLHALAIRLAALQATPNSVVQQSLVIPGAHTNIQKNIVSTRNRRW